MKYAIDICENSQTNISYGSGCTLYGKHFKQLHKFAHNFKGDLDFNYEKNNYKSAIEIWKDYALFELITENIKIKTNKIKIKENNKTKKYKNYNKNEDLDYLEYLEDLEKLNKLDKLECNEIYSNDKFTCHIRLINETDDFNMLQVNNYLFKVNGRTWKNKCSFNSGDIFIRLLVLKQLTPTILQFSGFHKDILGFNNQYLEYNNEDFHLKEIINIFYKIQKNAINILINPQNIINSINNFENYFENGLQEINGIKYIYKFSVVY